MRFAVCATVIAIAVVAPGSAFADGRGVAPVLASWQDGNTEAVIAGADRALADASLAPADRIAVLQLRGAALAVEGRSDDATATFKQVFAIDPAAQLASYLNSPSLQALYGAARGAWRAETDTYMREHHAGELEQVKVLLAPPPGARGGTTLAFDIDVVDPGHLGSRLLFSYKRRTSLEYTVLAQPAGPHARFAIPDQLTEARAPYALDYYVVLRADNGFDVATVGELGRPRTLAVGAGQRPPPPAPVYRRWWFWGAIATSAALVGFFAYRAEPVGPQQGVSRSSWP